MLLAIHGIWQSGSPSVTPPSIAPILDAQSTLGSYQASLTWTASNRTSSPGFGYKVELDIDGGGFNEIVSTTNLFYTDTQGSAAGETYTYRVTPYNDNGEGPTSNEAGIVLPGESDDPVLTGWGEGGDGSNLAEYYVSAVNLNWNAIAGATNYNIYRADDLGSFSLLDSTSGTSYRDATVDWAGGAGVQYDYKVVATAGAFSSGDSNTLSFTPLPPPPPPSSSTFLILNSGARLLLNSGAQLILNG